MNSARITVHGGLSVLSAFSSGKGSAAAIGLKMTVEVFPVMQAADNTKMINRTLSYLRRKYSIKEKYGVRVRSGIPTANGLKSSSALTVAIVAGVLHLNRISLSDEELLALAADVSIYNHTSITGAMDDLCSSYYGGVCLTDNINRRIVRRDKMPDYPLVIAATARSRRTATLKKYDFSGISSNSAMIENLIMEGRYLEAMTLNGLTYGSILGMRLDLVGHFLRNGALCSSQSGKGPAVFGVFKTQENADSAAKNFPDSRYFRAVKTGFSNNGIKIEEYRP